MVQARKAIGLAIAVGCLGVTGCAHEAPELRPAAGVSNGTSGREISQLNHQVRFTAEAVPWSGPASIKQAVTPVRVVIQNQGNTPIIVGLSHFVLVAPDGTRYAALPPFKINGTVLDPQVGYTRMAPEFQYRGFLAAPYYGPIYPEFPQFTEFEAEPSYYDLHYAYWRKAALPTPQMLASALPEGALEPGGWLAGWLYFEQVSDDDKSVDLKATFLSAQNQSEVATFDMPFRVVD